MRRLADGLGIVAGGALLIYCFAVGVEILGRRFFGFSLQGVDEVGGYLMALIVAVGFTCALYGNAHIRIDLLLPHLPRAVTLWLNVAALASMIAFALFLVWQGASVLTQSYNLKAVAPTPLLTPLAIPQGIWVAALLFFLFATLACFVKALVHALRGEVDETAARP
jgi:TRAP-type C4-dicarboxylate transport system permease small subunit